MSHSLYVARRSFKAQGILYVVGEIINDPSAIKLFRSRLNARDVLELSKDSRDLASWINYLEARVPVLDERLTEMLNIQIAEKEALDDTQELEDLETLETVVPVEPVTPEKVQEPVVPVTPVQVVKPATVAKATVVKATAKNS